MGMGTGKGVAMSQLFEHDEAKGGTHAAGRRPNRGIAVATLIVSCLALVVSSATLAITLTDRDQVVDVASATEEDAAADDSSLDTSDDDQAASDEDAQGEASEDASAESVVLSGATLEADVTSSIDDGSWHVEVAEVTVTGAQLDVELAVTNNTSEASNYYISIALDAYQNGMQLQEESYPDNQSGKVQPGTTFSMHKVYELNDTEADVMVELTYLTSDVEATETWSLA